MVAYRSAQAPKASTRPVENSSPDSRRIMADRIAHSAPGTAPSASFVGIALIARGQSPLAPVSRALR